MKLLVLDGNSIVNRAFYGIKLLATKDGQYTNGIYGFINILNKLIELEKPDGVAVAFDVHKPTFRHERYAEYKAGRKGMPEELRGQIPLLKEWITLMGYRCVELAGFEADDILGTLAAAAEKRGDECVIATGDRDALQLVSPSTKVLLTSTKMGKPEMINYTTDAVFEKYGIYPDALIDLKALMGDPSDNIPGVAGVGEKTASFLLQRFGSLDYIYENIENLDIKDTLKAKLIEGKEKAYLSRWLGTINREVDVCTDISCYSFSPRQDDELCRLMTKLELFKLMESMDIHPDTTKTSDKSSTKKVLVTDNFDDLDTLDIYTELPETLFGFASGDKVCVLDFAKEPEKVKALLQSDSKKRVYDYKNLCKFCITNDIRLNNVVFDSLLAGYLSNPSASSYEIARLFQEYGASLPEIDGDNYIFLENTLLNNAICDKLTEVLTKNNEMSLLLDIEIPLACVLGEMELNGFLIDREGIKNYGDALSLRIEQIQKEIFSLTGFEFNLNSPKQLGVALFEKLGLPAKKKTKSGYSTNAEVLEEIRTEHPAVELLLEYRSLSKLKSTYCDGLYNAVGSDGRIHSTFNQTETRTGRISSLEPNLQNIPVRQEEGKQLRKFFISQDGYCLCDADYSQIELRVLAHIANDTAMINAFNNDIDIHTLTASEAFDMPIDMVTPIMRSRAKAVNFGIVYGIGAFSLSKDIGVTRAEANKYIQSYLNTYPNVDRYMKEIIEQAKVDGFVTTLFGRRRYLPELSSSNGMLRSFGERVARNAPIQGTAADIIKIAMVRVNARLKKENLDARLILQVHDELIVECRDDIKDTVCRILEEEMQSTVNLRVALTVSAQSGKNWLDAKD